MTDHVARPDRVAHIVRKHWRHLTLALLLFSLYLVSRYSYLLFHGLAEVFSFVVGYSIFILTWNSRRRVDNGFFLFVGIASLCVGVVDLVHMLAYKGMNIFPDRGANLATQLWIAARYLQAVALLMATALIGARFRTAPAIAASAAATMAVLAAVLAGVFPVCYIEGEGLTPFKIASEYFVSLLFLAAGANLIRRRSAFDADTVRALLLFLGLSIAAELSFTAYVSVFGFANLAGHLLRLLAAYCLYITFARICLHQPHASRTGSAKLREPALGADEDRSWQPLQQRFYLRQWLILALAMLLLGSALGVSLYTERKSIEAGELQKLALQARRLGESIEKQLHAINHALDALRADPHILATSVQSKALIGQHLQVMGNAMLGMRTLLVLDAAGRATASNRGQLIGQAFGAREYFLAARLSRDRAMLHVSLPYETFLGVNAISIVKTVLDSQGTFAGVVAATLEPEYFSALLDSARYAPDVSISLARDSGELILMRSAQSGAEGVDPAIPGSIPAHHIDGGQAAVAKIGILPAANDERLLAVHSVKPAAVTMEKLLEVAVSRNESATLADWRGKAYQMGALYGLFLLIAPPGLLVYQQRQRRFDRIAVALEDRREQAEHLRRASDGRFRSMFEDNDSVMLLIDSDTGAITDANIAAARFYGYSIEHLRTLHVEQINTLPPREIAAKMTSVAGKEGGFFMFSHRLASGEVRTVEVRATPIDVGERILLFSIVIDVTERVRAEDDLRESKALYQSVIATSLDGFCMIDLEGRLLEVNGAYERMSGYACAELAGMRLTDLDAAESEEDGIARIRRCVASGGDLYETVHRKKDGTLWQVEINAHYAPATSGRLFVFARDIYQRKRIDTLKKMQLGFAEVMLRGSLDNLLQAILDAAEMLTSSQIGFFHFVDPDQEHIRLQGWSTNTLAHMCRAKGKGQHYPVSEAGVWVDCVKARKAVIHNDYASLAHRKGLPEGHAPVIRELTVPVIVGGLVVALIGVGNKPGLYTDDDVATVEELGKMAIDMVEGKRAQEALHESEGRLHALFEYSPVPIWEVDLSALKAHLDALRAEGVNDWRAYLDAHPQEISRCAALGKLLDVNRASVTFLRGESKAAVMRGAHNCFPPESMRGGKEELIALAQGRAWFECDLPMQTLEGETKTVSCRLAVVPDVAQSWAHVLISFMDMSERKRLEDAARQTQKLESLGTLAGGIAHDFNNILAAIQGNADLAVEDTGPDHGAMQSLEEIRKGCARASELVRRISAFGRPKSIKHEVVDLGTIVGEVFKLLRATLPTSVALYQEFTRDTPQVLADAGQIHEAIVNLTTNAAYAIGRRTGAITYRLMPVQVSEERAVDIPGLKPGRYALLRVTDNGCGMDAAVRGRIFDAFYTTKPVGEGTGLGLSMLYGTMQSHGGAVEVTSAPGKGSSFALYFPAAKQEAQTDERETPAPMSLSAGQRVLYLDDEEALVLLARRTLSRLGYRVSGFSDPQEALKALRAHPLDFDVVVTDLSMPHMSGFEFAREVRALRPGTPVLILSGYVREGDEERARAAGVREIILKPIALDELARALDRSLRNSDTQTPAPVDSAAAPAC